MNEDDGWTHPLARKTRIHSTVTVIPNDVVERLRFDHEWTKLDIAPDLVAGTTRWTEEPNAHGLYLLWGWTMISPGCVCVSNPLAIESNLYVSGEDPRARAIHLFGLVNDLPWQLEVLRELGSTH